MGKGELLSRMISIFLMFGFGLLAKPVFARTISKSDWRHRLADTASLLEKKYPSSFGIHVKDLQSGAEFGHRQEERWYVASGVKVPIALAVMKEIQEGRLFLDSKVLLMESDYVDGAGNTNDHPPGTELTVEYLLEQMLIHSDNTASDLLIRAVGLSKVNDLIAALDLGGFSPITTLAQVRRLAFASFHPGVESFDNRKFMKLKTFAREPEKLRALSHMLGVGLADLKVGSIRESYGAYYGSGANSATLSAYTRLLEKLVRGEILDPKHTQILLAIMSRVETGKNRLIAGLGESVVFAHKTGTQYARVCDFGIATLQGRSVVISSCVRDIVSLKESEALLKKLGQAIRDSGVFVQKP